MERSNSSLIRRVSPLRYVPFESVLIDFWETTADEELNDEQRDQLEAAARHLYGLIHARFIITSRGLTKMVRPPFPPLPSPPLSPHYSLALPFPD